MISGSNGLNLSPKMKNFLLSASSVGKSYISHTMNSPKKAKNKIVYMLAKSLQQ